MKLIIFDVDGVLETEDDLIEARTERILKEISKKHGVSVEDAKHLLQKARRSLPEEKRKTTVYAVEKLGFTRKHYFDMINSVSPEGLIESYPGSDEILRELSKKYVLVAFSNTPKIALVKTLKLIDAYRYMQKIYSVEDFKESKPSSSIIKQIMDDQESRPENTVSIGNSLEKDILPSKKAQTTTILFDPNKKFNGKPDGADYIIRDLREIMKIV